MVGLLALWVALIAISSSAWAQTNADALATASFPPSPGERLLSAGTPIEVELTDAVSSKTAKAGERFGLKLADDIRLDGRVVLAAPGVGYGEVVDAAPAKTMGRPGKLILVARALDTGEIHLRLRGFGLPAEGHDASKPVTTLSSVPYVGILAIGMTGGNVEYPAGTHVIVKLAADVVIPVPASSGSSPPAPPALSSKEIRP